MSIEKITSKIIGDAEQAASAVRADAAEKCDEIIRAAEAKAEEILADGQRRGAEEKEKLITRKKSVADIDGRKMILETKQKLISQCFDAAADRIVSLEKDRYIAFLTALVKKTGEKEGEKMILETKQKLISQCFDAAADRIVSLEKDRYIAFLTALVKKTGEKEGELILNPNDRSRLGEELISALNAEIEGCRITLSSETRSIRGGFLLKKGLIYMNGTVEMLIEEAREKLAGEVASQLFG